jgi:hypothetical protein
MPTWSAAALQARGIRRIDMRVFYPLVMAASLSLVPAVSFASTARATSADLQESEPVLHESAAARPSASPTQAPKKASIDERRYAAREQASPDAAEYRGGDTVVIGATAATAILAVLLLVVLL